jgi:hypothetical protein
MKLAPSGIGAEPKKLALLVGLLLTAGVVYYWMNRPEAPPGASTSPAPAVKTPVSPAPATPSATARAATASYGPRTQARGGRVSVSGDDFRPTLKPPEGLDLTRVDPTLKTDLLGKVRKVSVEGGSRSLFEFYTPPPPPVPVPKPAAIVPKPLTAADGKPPQPPGPPPTPPPPPIPLKFYGYSGALRSNVRRAFFLDGEDIVQAGENETIRNRYKIVRIGVNSAVVEDTVAKNQQTLALADEAP